MIDSLLTSSVWFPLGAALLLHALDAWLSMVERYNYHSGARLVIFMPEQYPLEKLFRPAAGIIQFWDRRTTLFLIGVALVVPLSYYVFVIRESAPWVFVFLMGGLLLYEVAECMRLGRMLTLFRAARDRQGVEGYLSVPRWLTANLFVIDLYSFGLLYLLFFFGTGSMFFLGGAAACFIRAHATRDFAVFSRWIRGRKGSTQ